MKTVYLIRHAKSSWDDPDLDDFDRPLNERGEKDAPRMGKRLKESGVVPDQIITSPAVRALSTAEKICKALGCPGELIHQDRNLYHADEERILRILHDVSDKHDCVFIVGHNPGLTEFANALMHDKHIDNIPTTGIVEIKFNVSRWQDIRWGSGSRGHYDYPKKS